METEITLVMHDLENPPSQQTPALTPNKSPLLNKLNYHLTSLTADCFLARTNKPVFLITRYGHPPFQPKFATIYTFADFLLLLSLYITGPNSTLESILAFDPCRRNQIWRFWTYSYFTQSLEDLVFLAIFKFYLIAVCEVLNGTPTVVLIAYFGTIFGSLVPSVLYPMEEIRGLGGICGFLGLAMANYIMNSEIYKFAFVPIGSFIYILLYCLFTLATHYNTAFISHMCSILGGFLAAVYLLGAAKNWCYPCDWKNSAGRIALTILVLLLGYGMLIQRIDAEKFKCKM